MPSSTTTLYTGQIATVTGWGGADPHDLTIPSDDLKEAKVKVWANDECIRTRKKLKPKWKPLTRYTLKL